MGTEKQLRMPKQATMLTDKEPELSFHLLLEHDSIRMPSHTHLWSVPKPAVAAAAEELEQVQLVIRALPWAKVPPSTSLVALTRLEDLLTVAVIPVGGASTEEDDEQHATLVCNTYWRTATRTYSMYGVPLVCRCRGLVCAEAVAFVYKNAVAAIPAHAMHAKNVNQERTSTPLLR